MLAMPGNTPLGVFSVNFELYFNWLECYDRLLSIADYITFDKEIHGKYGF